MIHTSARRTLELLFTVAVVLLDRCASMAEALNDLRPIQPCGPVPAARKRSDPFQVPDAGL